MALDDKMKRLNSPWYVRTKVGDNLTEGHDSEEAAKVHAARANERAKALGISERYIVVPNERAGEFTSSS